MTKEQYMTWKIRNPLNILYHYYISHEKLNHPPLDIHNLVMHLQMNRWDINTILQNIMPEYDEKFGIVALLDQNGQLIKYL